MSTGSGGGPQFAPNVFQPPNQGAVAQGWQQLMAPQAQLGLGDLNTLTALGTPFTFAYPRVLNAALSSGTVNPFANQMVGGAQQAGQFFNQYVPQNATTGAGQLQQMAGMAPGQAQNVINAANNPAYAQAGGLAAQTSPQLAGMASTIANQSFDPQGALFNRLQQQQLDQSTVANAMAGLGSSPYGASVTSNALGNMDINWQNQLLNRMTQGGQAASALDQAAIVNMLTPANNAVNAQAVGAQALNQLIAGSQGAYAGAGNLLNNAAQGIGQYAGLPYNALQGLYGTDLNAMQSLQSLGLGGTTLGQQALSDASQYLNLGVNAANVGAQAANVNNQIGNTNFNQLAGGLGGAQQLLFGNSLANSGGLLGNLFSGGGAAGAGNLTGAAALPGFDTLGGTVGMGELGGAFGGGSDALLSLAFLGI